MPSNEESWYREQLEQLETILRDNGLGELIAIAEADDLVQQREYPEQDTAQLDDRRGEDRFGGDAKFPAEERLSRLTRVFQEFADDLSALNDWAQQPLCPERFGITDSDVRERLPRGVSFTIDWSEDASREDRTSERNQTDNGARRETSSNEKSVDDNLGPLHDASESLAHAAHIVYNIRELP